MKNHFIKKYFLASGFAAMAFFATASLVQAKTVPNSVSRPVAATKVVGVTGSFVSLNEILKDFPLDFRNGYTDDQLDEIIALYKIDLKKGEKVPKGLVKATVLRVKLLSYVISEQVKSDQYNGVGELGPDGITLKPVSYKKILFDVDLIKKQYIIYPDINAENFVRFYNQYLKPDASLYSDNRYLYVRNGITLNRFKGVDAASFKLMAGTWLDEELELYRDRNRVYHISGKNLYEIIGSDPPTFSAMSGVYKDRKYIYFYDAKNKIFKTVIGADATTFKRLPVVYGNFLTSYDLDLWKDKNAVYYFDSKNSEWRRMKNLDVSKASFIYGGIMKYKSKIFYISSTTPEPVKVTDDAAHFTAVPQSGNALYSDLKNIYAYSPKDNAVRKLVVDKNSFKLLTNSAGRDAYPIIFKDKNSVYTFDNDFKQLKISFADQATLEVLYDGYNVIVAKDKNNVYYSPEAYFHVLPGADPETFEVIKYGGIAYAKDKNKVYVVSRNDYKVHALDDADPKSFAIIKVGNWYYYGKDGQGHIWLYDNNTDTIMNLRGVDPETFDYEAHAREYFGG